MFRGVFEESIIHRASQKDLIDIRLLDLRTYGIGTHKVVDDTPYGGGGGMVLKPEPIANALEDLSDPGLVVLTSPRGKSFTQEIALALSKQPEITIICGHYEGVDERVRTLFVDEEFSIGDYVLTGGEIPSMVMLDAIVRLIPGVLGRDTIETGDSHYDGLLEHPQYTRPQEFKGLNVPEILLSGNHLKINRWRRKMALKKTREQRPDLFNALILSKEDKQLLKGED